MPGCIVQVWFKVSHEHGGRPGQFRIIETEFEDFAQCAMAVNDPDEPLIGGAILYTRHGETRNEKVIIDRRPIAFRGAAVDRMELPTWRFLEVE